MKKTYADVQTVRQGVTTLINIDEKAHCEGVIRRHEGCQFDTCRSQDVGETSHVLPYQDATTVTPEAEAGQEKT